MSVVGGLTGKDPYHVVYRAPGSILESKSEFFDSSFGEKGIMKFKKV